MAFAPAAQPIHTVLKTVAFFFHLLLFFSLRLFFYMFAYTPVAFNGGQEQHSGCEQRA